MIRPTTPRDLEPLQRLIDATGLFPGELLAEMLTPHFAAQADPPGLWLTDDDHGPVGIAYYAPERMTEGTWNLYLIAIHPDRQGQGRGAALVRHIEADLTARGQRILLVETSGLPEFALTRAFYRKHGYHEEARIRDFYRAGEDKIVFRKALASVVAPSS